MIREDIDMETIPEMKDALFIACFDGWGNALGVSVGIADYLIRKLRAEPFGSIKSDRFYLYKERRPIVEVRDGILSNLELPGCDFYAVSGKQAGRDMIILKGKEPDLQWFRFTDAILTLCKEIGVKTIVSCGGMLDSVLPTETVISVVASSEGLLDGLSEKEALLINYEGPSSIHSTLHSEAKKGGFDCLGLYGHCPYYLQGVIHYGLLSYMTGFLAEWGGFELDTHELSAAWKDLTKQILEAINKNAELKHLMDEIKKNRGEGKPDAGKKGDKVVKIEDYLRI